jgi:hypothetical protein
MGFSFSQFVSLLTTIAPVVLLAVPGGGLIAPLMPLIVQGIADAHTLPGASGADKKAYVLQLVADATQATALIKPGTIDPALALQAASHGIDAVITSINAVQVAHAALPLLPTIVVPVASAATQKPVGQ